MNTSLDNPGSTDHRPYIETARVALLLKDVHVGVASFSTHRVRWAAMTLFLRMRNACRGAGARKTAGSCSFFTLATESVLVGYML